MGKRMPVLIVVLFVFGSSLAFGAGNRHGVGIGLTTGTVVPEDVGEETGWAGVTLFGKIGITDQWGIQILIREMEDDEPPAVANGEYTQFSVHGVYMWRHEHRL